MRRAKISFSYLLHADEEPKRKVDNWPSERPTSARSVNRSIRSASAALDGLSDAQLSTFRFGSSPACDR